MELTWRSDIPKESLSEGVTGTGRLTEELRRDVERFPNSAGVKVNFAVALLNEGHWDQAEVELSNALALEPNNYLAKINLARLLAGREQFDRAIALYNELLGRRANDKTVLLSLAAIALRRNDYSEAERLLNLVSGGESDATIHFLLGLVRLITGNLQGALSELRMAARADVRNPTIHQALGVVFALRSDLGRAEQEFRSALMLAPNDRASIRSLYQVLLKQDKANEAVDLLKLVVERNPADFSAREALAFGLVDLKQFSSARFQLSRMLAEQNNLPAEQVERIHANIALSWFLEGKVDSAKNALRKAIETYPNVSPVAYENLARLYLSQDDAEAARDILVQARRVFPDRTATAVLLSHVYSLLGAVERSIKELEAFKGRSDAPVELYVHLSFYYTLNGSLEQSVEVAKEGLKKFSHSPMLMNNLAYVYAMTDRIEEARTALRMVNKEIPPHVELIATRGLLRLREGDEKQGMALYKEAEHLATDLGNRELARRVRQKKHLELARFLVRKNSFDKARVEIKHGLAIRVKNFSYEEDLLQLAKDLESML